MARAGAAGRGLAGTRLRLQTAAGRWSPAPGCAERHRAASRAASCADATARSTSGSRARLLPDRSGAAARPGHAGITQSDRDGWRSGTADIDRPLAEPSPAHLDHQSRRDGLRLYCLLRLELLLEPGRGLASQPELERRAVDVGAVPVGDLH